MDVFLPAGRSTESTPILLYYSWRGLIDGARKEFLSIQRKLIRISFQIMLFVAINYRLFDFYDECKPISQPKKMM